jgi:hypothetical protein
MLALTGLRYGGIRAPALPLGSAISFFSFYSTTFWHFLYRFHSWLPQALSLH